MGHGVHKGERHHVAHELVEMDILVERQDLGQPGGPQPGQASPEHQHLAGHSSREPPRGSLRACPPLPSSYLPASL